MFTQTKLTILKKLFVVDTAHMKDVHYLLRSFFSRLQ